MGVGGVDIRLAASGHSCPDAPPRLHNIDTRSCRRLMQPANRLAFAHPHDPPVVHLRDAVGELEDAGVVRHDDQRPVRRPARPPAAAPSPCGRSRGPARWSARRRRSASGRAPAPARSRRAAAGRRRAAIGSELRAVAQADAGSMLLRLRQRRCRGMPLISSGTDAFSAAVSVGSRLNAWKTNPIVSPR